VVGGWWLIVPNNKQQSTHNNPRELSLHVLALVLVYITFYPNNIDAFNNFKFQMQNPTQGLASNGKDFKSYTFYWQILRHGNNYSKNS